MAKSVLNKLNIIFFSICPKVISAPLKTFYKMEIPIAEEVTKLLQRLKDAERRAKILKIEIQDIRSQIAVLTESSTQILNLSASHGPVNPLNVLKATQNSAFSPATTSKRKFCTEVDSGPNKILRADFTLANDYVVVYTDGACENNGKSNAKAGIGIWFGDDHPLNISEPVKGRATNNTAEIQAAYEALSVLKNQSVQKVKLFTDSQFLINCITKWIKNWKKNNWKLASGGPVKNKEDLSKLDSLLTSFSDVKWEYVPGHKGVEGNEKADQLARAGAARYRP